MSPLITTPTQKKRPIIGVGVCVFRHGDTGLDILLLQRPNGEWTLPGGKQEWGETFHECGQREIMEETGISTTIHPNFCAVSDYIQNDVHFTLLTLTGWAITDTIVMEDAHDIADVRWFSVHDAMTLPMWERTIDVIKMAKDTLQ